MKASSEIALCLAAREPCLLTSKRVLRKVKADILALDNAVEPA